MNCGHVIVFSTVDIWASALVLTYCFDLIIVDLCYIVLALKYDRHNVDFGTDVNNFIKYICEVMTPGTMDKVLV